MTTTPPKPTTAVATTKPAPRQSTCDLSKALVIRTPDGVIKQIRRKVKLSVKDGTLCKMGTMTQTNSDGSKSALFVISAPGFTELAGKCGVVALPTPTITVNGEVQPNPYPDEKTGKVYARAIALGYTDVGQMVPTSRTIVYDFRLANLIDLIAKAKYTENAAFLQLWPLERDDKGKLVRPEGLGARWTGYQVDDAMVLWVDCSAPRMMQWQGEMTNRRDKAIRTCETFAARNAIACHPAIPRQRKYDRAEATVDCVAWFAAEGTMRFGKELLQMDPEKLIAMESERTGKDIAIDHREENLTDVAAVEEIDSADVDETEPAKEDDDDPLPLDDNLNMGGAPEKTENADDVAARKTLVDEIAAIEKTAPKGPVRRGRIAVGLNDTSDLATADIEKLKALVEYHRQNKA